MGSSEVKVGFYMPQEADNGIVERIEVMAIVKGYCMWRYKGRYPNTASLRMMADILTKRKAISVKK